jgi:hypothetical protein
MYWVIMGLIVSPPVHIELFAPPKFHLARFLTVARNPFSHDAVLLVASVRPRKITINNGLPTSAD